MRIILAALIWVLFIGGLLLHMASRQSVPVAQATLPGEEATNSPSHYTLEITPGFSAAPDPFALVTEAGERAPLLTVRMGGRTLLRVEEEMAAGVPIPLSPVEGLAAGENEIYIQASPPVEEAGKSHALRVRILDEGIPLAEKTFWSAPGGAVGGTFAFTLAETEEREDGHGH